MTKKDFDIVQSLIDSTDIMNAAMVIPNMISVLMCLPQIKKDTKYYLVDDHLDEVDESLE